MDSQAGAGTPRAAASQRKRQRHPDMEAAGREPRPQPGAPGAGTPAALLLALQRTAGNGAVSRAIGLQRTLTNDATWGPVEPTTGQGTSVRAVSGPGYTYGSGPKSPAPGFRPYLYTAMFSAATTGAYYCQGHLLNDNLGGPGDPAAAHAAQNLTAFPQRPTNTDHKSAIENPIKSAALGAWYLYEVTIGYSTDSAPRLRRRLGVNAAMAPAAGIAATDTTFTYASSLSAQWTELVQGLASTNAAPPVKPAGDAGTLSLSIPSPMTFTTNEAGEYPNYVKTGSYQHMPKLKGNQAANRIGTLPGGGSATLAGRAYVLPMRWEAVDFARAGNPAPPPGKNATYQAGFQHYGDGVTGSRTGVTVTRYGLGFTLGYADFEAGLVHGRAHAQASPPAPPPAATVDGHNEFWAGVVLGRTSLLAAPPVGNRAHIAGHHEFWAGVLHARSNPELPAPVNLAEATGHNEYWAGVNLALTTLKATKPAGNLASEEGHQAYWEGAEAARADPAAPVVPSTTAKVMGHTDFINGVTHARANPRVTAPAMGSLARSASWTEYWQGVDFARANPAATPCAGPSSAEKAGAADYREGADAASKDLGSFAGAPPVGGGAREGFEDLTSGAKGHQAGTPADAARTAHVRGWQDSAAGMAAGGAVAPAPPVRTDGGFMSGFLHAHGGALAQGAQPAPAGGLEQSVAGGGHAAYGTGLAAARADLASVAPVPLVQAQAHGEFVAGVVHARASGRGAAPAAGSLARTQAWTEYWQGVD
ncbi:MAG: hypothetical protein L0H96_14675, partial [Humibacillus sp.]|nr:hypothetical protein [Humibacillus sp.]